VFNVDFRQIALNNMPWLLQKEPLKAYVAALVKPLQELHLDFRANRDRNLLLVQHSFSKASVEHILNTVWPAANGGIYVENVINALPVDFDFYATENQPEEHIYFASEGHAAKHRYFAYESATGFDFIVWVPNTLSFDKNLLKWYVERYRQIGKTYTIKKY